MRGYAFLLCRRLYAFSFRVQKIAETTQKRTLHLCSYPSNLAMMGPCSIGQNSDKIGRIKKGILVNLIKPIEKVDSTDFNTKNPTDSHRFLHR